MSFFGGLPADRILGQRRTVILGGALVALAGMIITVLLKPLKRAIVAQPGDA